VPSEQNEKLSQKSSGDASSQKADLECQKVIYTKIDKWAVIEIG
jgi:hypothetical protein